MCFSITSLLLLFLFLLTEFSFLTSLLLILFFIYLFSLIKIYIYTNMYIYIIDYTKTNTHIRQIYNICISYVCTYVTIAHTRLFYFVFFTYFFLRILHTYTINQLFISIYFFSYKINWFFIYTLWLLLSNHL